MEVERPRWTNNVRQHPDTEKEAQLSLNISRWDENFPRRKAPLATIHRLGEALVEGDVCNVVVMKEGIPL